MTGQLAAQLAACAALALATLAGMVTTWRLPQPWSSAVRTDYEIAKLKPWAKWVKLAASVVAVAAMAASNHLILGMSWRTSIIFATLMFVGWYGYRRFIGLAVVLVFIGIISFAHATQGMMATQLLAVMLCLAAGNKVYAAMLIGSGGKPRGTVASVPLWLVIGAVAVVLDGSLVRTAFDQVFVAWDWGVFENPRSPEGLHSGFWHQFAYAEQHLGFGIFTPTATALLLGALAMWAKVYRRKSLIVLPFAGWLAGLGTGLGLALFTQQDVVAAPLLLAGAGFGTVLGSLRSRCDQLIWCWSQSYHSPNSEHHTL